jgi:hypothetical protein
VEIWRSSGLRFLPCDVSPALILRCLSRLGSCGALVDIPVGSVVIPRASVAVNRNVDFDFLHPDECPEKPYLISKPVRPDPSHTSTQVTVFTDAPAPVDPGRP